MHYLYPTRRQTSNIWQVSILAEAVAKHPHSTSLPPSCPHQLQLFSLTYRASTAFPGNMMQVTFHIGWRCSGASKYLHSALKNYSYQIKQQIWIIGERQDQIMKTS